MRWPWQRGPEERRYTLAEVRSLSFQDVFGQGLDIDSFRSASLPGTLSLVSVFACCRFIGDSIAAMPLEAYRKVGDEQVPMDLPSLFTDPSIYGGTFEWVQRALTSKLLRGNAYGLITEFDYAGWPRQVEWLHPDEVSLLNDSSTQVLLYYGGRVDWRLLGHRLEQWKPRGQGIPGQLVHVPWYVLPGTILGLSPISAFRTTFDAGRFAQKYGRDWFRSGGHPSGVLSSDQPVSQTQAEEAKARFKAATANSDVAVMGAGLNYKSVTIAPDEAQFLETIRANAAQVASIYGLPAGRIGGDAGTHSRTYANVEQESQDLVNALQPYLSKLEQAFSNLLPRGQFVRFNVDSTVRADMAARYAAYQIALGGQMGAGKPFMTVDEVRRIEGMEPLAVEEQETPLSLVIPPPPAAQGEA